MIEKINQTDLNLNWRLFLFSDGSMTKSLSLVSN